MKKPRQLINVEVVCTPELSVDIIQEPITGVDFCSEIVPGIRGTTFIPSVSSEGIISWTNDGDLPNPEPVSITGPQGEAGQQGEQGPVGPVGPAGPQGERGPQGNPTVVNGKSGESITLTAEDVGAISWADLSLFDCGTSTEVVS